MLTAAAVVPQVDNTSEQYYSSPYYLLHKTQIQQVPSPTTSPPHVDLANVLGPVALAPIVAAEKITFHAVGDTGAAKVNVSQTALTGFLRNFCASAPDPSPDSGGILRSTMDQPGVYFTLDAPFVSIIGLYTNVLEGPGVISSQGGKYPLSDDQLQFLTAELTRLKPARAANERAVIIACHHPPASVDAVHGGGTGLATDIDTACENAGLHPDAVLSGHAHLYQRFTRVTGGRQIPYVVGGSGGFAATAPQHRLGKAPVTFGECTLVSDPVVAFGYLTLTVDMTTASPELTIHFQACLGSSATDTVTVNLATGALT